MNPAWVFGGFLYVCSFCYCGELLLLLMLLILVVCLVYAFFAHRQTRYVLTQNGKAPRAICVLSEHGQSSPLRKMTNCLVFRGYPTAEIGDCGDVIFTAYL